ncbi:MAG: hypothetical protein HYY44_02755, partial [Deltaproteobacteria bacterium]|nr:hypothetical protein [Deltaproteobacteria bacterium]
MTKRSPFTSVLILLSLSLALSLPALGTDENEKKEEQEKVPARESSTFGIYPPIIDLECPPGQSVSTTIKVDNPNKLTAAFEMLPIGLTATPEGLDSKPIASLPPDHLGRHLRLESPQIIVPGRS